MTSYTSDPRIDHQKLEAEAHKRLARPVYAAFQQQADTRVVIKQEAILLEDIDSSDGNLPSFGVIKTILSCEVCKNVPMLPIMQCDNCAAFYCERCLIAFNKEKHGVKEAPSKAKEPEKADTKEKAAPKNERERRKELDEVKKEKDQLELRLKKQLRCKACHKHLKISKKGSDKGHDNGQDKGEESDEIESYTDANGYQRQRVKQVKFSSRIARNLLRHLEFKHVCDEDGEEQILSYEEFVRHCRFSCSKIREFSCREPGCSIAEDEKMSKAELEEHLSGHCEGVEVTCALCVVTLPGSQFSEHDCLDNQIVRIRKLRAQAVELLKEKKELEQQLKTERVHFEEVEAVHREIQTEKREDYRALRNANKQVQVEMRQKMDKGIEEIAKIKPLGQHFPRIRQLAKAGRRVEKKKEEVKAARQEEGGALEGEIEEAKGLLPLFEEEEPILDEDLDFTELDDDSVNQPLVPYYLSRQVTSVTNNVYGENEERRPYPTYFYKTLDYFDTAIESKFVAVRKYGQCYARSYMEFQRPLVMRGLGIRSANCCPMMDPVELWVLAKLPAMFEHKEAYCQELKPMTDRLNMQPTDLKGMMLVKHIKDIGFSDEREQLIYFRFDRAVLSTGLHFYVMSTKQSKSDEPEPHRGVQYKRLYVYQ